VGPEVAKRGLTKVAGPHAECRILAGSATPATRGGGQCGCGVPVGAGLGWLCRFAVQHSCLPPSPQDGALLLDADYIRIVRTTS
jgi:hypothetical protein